MSEGILLDTITFVENLQGALPSSVRQTVDQSNRRFLSVITPWEIHLKKYSATASARLTSTLRSRASALRSGQFCSIIFGFCGKCPRCPSIGDPFDRLLIAQACTHSLTIITSDRRFSLYPQLSLIAY